MNELKMQYLLIKKKIKKSTIYIFSRLVSYNQLVKKNFRRSKIHKTGTPALKGKPFIKGTCMKILIITPRKPNSAKRKVAKVRLSSRRTVFVAISGEGHNLQRHSNVLVRGGSVTDLPGVNYAMVAGKYDFKSPANRKKKRSKYGVRLYAR